MRQRKADFAPLRHIKRLTPGWSFACQNLEGYGSMAAALCQVRGAADQKLFRASPPRRSACLTAPLPVCEAWLRACGKKGMLFNPDVTGEVQDGVDYHQLKQWNMRRSSTPTAYLRPAQGRTNLALRTAIQVLRQMIGRSRAVGERSQRDPQFGHHWLTLAVAAFRDRPGRSSAAPRDPGSAGSARFRRGSPGSSAPVCHRGMQRPAYLCLRCRTALVGPGRTAIHPDATRPRRLVILQDRWRARPLFRSIWASARGSRDGLRPCPIAASRRIRPSCACGSARLTSAGPLNAPLTDPCIWRPL